MNTLCPTHCSIVLACIVVAAMGPIRLQSSLIAQEPLGLWMIAKTFAIMIVMDWPRILWIATGLWRITGPQSAQQSKKSHHNPLIRSQSKSWDYVKAGRLRGFWGWEISNFLHCEFSNVPSNYLPEKRQSHIGCICLAFLRYEFSNVSSNRLPEKMHSHIGVQLGLIWRPKQDPHLVTVKAKRLFSQF